MHHLPHEMRNRIYMSTIILYLNLSVICDSLGSCTVPENTSYSKGPFNFTLLHVYTFKLHLTNPILKRPSPTSAQPVEIPFFRWDVAMSAFLYCNSEFDTTLQTDTDSSTSVSIDPGNRMVSVELFPQMDTYPALFMNNVMNEFPKPTLQNLIYWKSHIETQKKCKLLTIQWQVLEYQLPK